MLGGIPQVITIHPDKNLYRLAMNIVNQLFELAGTSTEKRQEINDSCDQFVYNIIQEYYEAEKQKRITRVNAQTPQLSDQEKEEESRET